MAGAAITSPTNGQAQSEKSAIARCAAIDSPTQRLACFDALATRLGVARPAVTTTTSPGGIGTWKVSTETSPIDDSKNVYLMLEAQESIPGLIGTVRPTLVVRCKERKTEAYIIWGVYLGLEETNVLTRLDEEKATSTTWNISTDNKATFYRGSEIQWLRQLLPHRKLLAQVTPYGESPTMVTFMLTGMTQAMRPLQEACGWQ